MSEVVETSEIGGIFEMESDSDDEEMIVETSICQKEVNLKEFYDVAMALRKTIKVAQAMGSSWPPTEQVLKMVPLELFNFIAWTLDFSDYPQMSSHSKLQDSQRTKVLSICQDMLYVATNGRLQTPKSLPLGMAVRQLTRSSQLTQILNGFGHCASHYAILTYETRFGQVSNEIRLLYFKGCTKT